ncbi:MAG: SufE family protein [Cyclobacteriaceae bacterium]|nr:SufE family protein [Cyclobacteriaceae bacterium]
MSSIADIQQDIIDEFELISEDREATIFYIMELGQKLPEMSEDLKTEDNIIKGCQSKVWLTAGYEDGKVVFQADSNTDITKGLISLLIRVLSEQTPDDILNAELNFVEAIGMNQVIGSQRTNGFNSMIKQMKMYALGFKTKEQVNQ